jgi:hypothetical protein
MRAWAGEVVPGGRAATGGWSTRWEQQPLSCVFVSKSFALPVVMRDHFWRRP